MKWAAEAIVFGAAAVGLHLVAFVSTEQSASSGGTQGTSAVTLVGASQSLSTLVDTWDAPPMTSIAPLGLKLPPLPDAIPLPIQTTNFSQTIPQTMQAPIALEAPTPPKDVPTPPSPPTPAAPKVVEKPTPKPLQKPEVKPAAQQAQPQPNPSSGQREQRATGTGGGTGAAQSTAAAPAATSGKSKRLEAAWQAKINARVHSRMRYPRGTDKAATVVVRISLATTGHLKSVSVVKSSGVAVIDAAALEAVKRSGRFPRVPKGISRPTLDYNLTLKFTP
ncbi:TonB family protein [Maritalea sp.]|uniref:TonB family protein n=1 Tax=Maritalea sp. TaxID=2003361 RepID=UPI003EF34CE2